MRTTPVHELACLLATSFLTAATALAQPQTGNQQPEDCNANGVPDAADIADGTSFDADADGLPDECKCDRPADLVDAVYSNVDSGIADAFAADDFLVPKGVHRLQAVAVQMFTDSSAPAAAIDLLADECGLPGPAIHTFHNTDVRPVVDPTTGLQITYGNLSLYEFLFEPDDIWLPEGRYWVSAFGLGDGSLRDSTAWATAGNGVVRGERAHLLGFDPQPDVWTPIELCLPEIHKTDLSMCVFLDLHRVLWDNGKPTGEIPPKAINTALGTRQLADDFLLPPCREDQRISYVEAHYASNIPWPTVRMHVHIDDCGEPGAYITTLLPTRITATSGPDSNGVRTYHVEFCNLDLTLPPGERYWLVLDVLGTGLARDRAAWLPASRCDIPCGLQLSPALTNLKRQGWEDLAGLLGHKTDLAFRVVGQSRPVGSTAVECPPTEADIDQDGIVGPSDYFGFIAIFVRALTGG